VNGGCELRGWCHGFKASVVLLSKEADFVDMLRLNEYRAASAYFDTYIEFTV